MRLIEFRFCSKMLKIELKFIKYILDTFESHTENDIIYYKLPELTKKFKVNEDKIEKILDALVSKRYSYMLCLNKKNIRGKFSFLSSFSIDGNALMLIMSKEVFETFTPNTPFYESDIDSYFCLKNNKSIKLLLEVKSKKQDGQGYEIDLNEFKNILEINSEYKRFYDFERFILNDIIDDINKNSYVKITYQKIKKGKSVNSKVEGIVFYMLDKKQKLLINETNELLELVKYRVKDLSTIYHLIRMTVKKHGYQYAKANLEEAMDKKGRALDIIVIRALKENWANFKATTIGSKSLKLLYSESAFFAHYDSLLYNVYNQMKILGLNVDFNKEIRRQMALFSQTERIEYSDNRFKIQVKYHSEGRSNIRIYQVLT